MAGQGRTLMVYLAADSTKFNRGLGEAETRASGFSGAVGRMSSSITSMLGPALMGAGLAAGYMAEKFAVDSVKAFMEDDAAAQSLAGTFEQLGLATKATGVEDFIAKMETSAAVSDDELRPALDRLVRSTEDVGKAQDLLGLALDLSAKRHVSLEQASSALAKANDGAYGPLAKLAGGYSTAELKAMGFNGVVDALSGKFAGSASSAANTYAGEVKRLGIQLGNVQEAFGKGFMEGVAESMGTGAAAAARLTPVMESLAKSSESVGKNIGSMVGQFPMALAGLKTLWGGFSVVDAAVGSLISKFIAFGFAIKGDYAAASAIVAEADRKLLVATQALGTAWEDLTTGTVDGIPVTLSAATASDILSTSLSHQADILDRLGKASGAESLRYSALASSMAGDSTSTAASNLADYFKKPDAAASGFNSTAAAKGVDTLRQAVDAASASIDASYAPAITKVSAKIDGLTAAHDNLSKGIHDAITSTVSLSQAWADASRQANPDEAVAAGALTAFQKQIGDAASFATAIGALAGSPGVSEELIKQLKGVAESQGPIAGTALANEIISSGMAPELSKQLQDLDVFAGETGQTVSGRFYNQGITSAVELLNGLSSEVAAQKKELEKLGKNIGEPISKQIALEIAKAIDEGTKAGHAAAVEARALAEAAAFSQQSTSRITPTSAGQGLTAVVAASDQRTGATPPALLV